MQGPVEVVVHRKYNYIIESHFNPTIYRTTYSKYEGLIYALNLPFFLSFSTSRL